jgi:hypothetical protein
MVAVRKNLDLVGFGSTKMSRRRCASIFQEMKNRKVTPKQLLEQIKKLRNELFVTEVQFQLFVELGKTAPNYKEEIRATPLFWDYTKRAHTSSPVLISDSSLASLRISCRPACV